MAIPGSRGTGMAGAMKKAGYAAESFKSDKGERTYVEPFSCTPGSGRGGLFCVWPRILA
jgi:hypothetical protein